MALGATVYNLLFRRTSTYLLTILVGAVFFERTFDHAVDSWWDRRNKGVSVFFYLEHTSQGLHTCYIPPSEAVEAYKARI